jgi:hypothetical protein
LHPRHDVSEDVKTRNAYSGSEIGTFSGIIPSGGSNKTPERHSWTKLIGWCRGCELGMGFACVLEKKRKKTLGDTFTLTRRRTPRPILMNFDNLGDLEDTINYASFGLDRLKVFFLRRAENGYLLNVS